MLNDRRKFIKAALVTSAASVASTPAFANTATEERRWADSSSGRLNDVSGLPPAVPGVDYNPTITPNGSTLPYKVVDGVKVFHLICEEVNHQFAKGLEGLCWGFNGQVHGPTIEVGEGDRVRIYVTNRLIAPTSVHWHGIFLPSGMDGVGGVSQRAIKPGETFKYEFTLRQHGTFMYHSHHDEMTQMSMGMLGMFIVHPRGVPKAQRPDRDFVMMLSEWKIDPGTRRPDPNEMVDFNLLTINARCFPGTDNLIAKWGDKVRIRIGNLSAMSHHPIHLHGYSFNVVATDGGAIPAAGQWPETTVLVPVGSTRDIELRADAEGDWVMHCHMTHHVMNQMGHDIPNLIGTDPRVFERAVANIFPNFMAMGSDGMGEHGIHIERGHMTPPDNSIPMVGGWGPHDYITMGGLFTILKVRRDIENYNDPGWYKPPKGTLADVASKEDLSRDNIKG